MSTPGVERGVPVRAIAFYLPQYHPIPENDAWWGRGFTEWTNVVRARPQFDGHHQPHLPGELGFYDLRVAEVREEQAALARANGIYGFCYHYYWFGGRRLLQRPLDEVHRLGTPDLPFCVCWANENWSRRWDGSEDEILIAHAHSPSDDDAFLRSLLPLFADSRYIRVGDRPLFIVYRPDILPHAVETIARWRAICRSESIADPYIVGAQTFGTHDPTSLGFDAAVEFPPHGVADSDLSTATFVRRPSFEGGIYDFATFAQRAVAEPPTAYTRFRTVMPAWDNTARRKNKGTVFVGSSPERYEWWLRAAVAQTQHELPEDRRFVFINAWNEWGEGCHLEPDERNGEAYLRVTRAVIAETMTSAENPLVSVVVRVDADAGELGDELETIFAQTYDNIEVVVVVAGSTAAAAERSRALRDRHPAHRIRVLPAGGADASAAWNTGVRAAEGEFVALFEPGDRFAQDRLLVLVAALRETGSRFAFSRCGCVVPPGEGAQPARRAAIAVRGKQRRIAEFPSVGYALLDDDVTVSPGNFVFERSLFDDAGGFSSSAGGHWAWALRTLRYGDPCYVDEELYTHVLSRSRARAMQELRTARDAAALVAQTWSDERGEGAMPSGYPSARNFGEYHDRFMRERGYRPYSSTPRVHAVGAEDMPDAS